MKKKTLQISPPLATPSEGDDMQGFLLFRSNTWNFRRKIPVELRRYFGGTKEIWRSLKTSARAEALKPCREWATKTDRVFQFIRSSSPEEMKLAYIASEISPSRTAVLNAPPSPATGLSVTQLIQKFIAFKMPNWSLKSLQENEFNLGLFVDVMGDIRLSRIDYEVIEAYRDKLSQLPANHTRLKKYKTKTVKELIALPVDEKDMPEAENTNKHLSFFSTMLSFAVQRQFMTYNPAIGINLKSPGTEIIHASGHKKKYTDEDLQNLIQLLRWQPDYPAQFYVPLIGMFTGARRGEICQLYINDVQFDEKTGIPCLDINARGDMVPYKFRGEIKMLSEKRVKKNMSWRIIPIHPFLWFDLGFAGYYEQCKRTGQKRLFEELGFTRDGFGQSFSKIFDDEVAVKIADKNTRKSFHSIRHAFTDFFKQRQVEGYDRGMANEIVKEFVGHAFKKTGEEDLTLEWYGKRYPVATSASVLFQLDYGLNYDNITEQVGHLIALGGKADTKRKQRPDMDYPTEDTSEQ